MNRRIIGLFMAVVAVGTSVIVLLRSEKPRRFLQTRVAQVRGVLPGPEQVRESAQHLASDAKGTTAQAMDKVKQTGSDLAEKAKQLTAVGKQDGR